MTEVWPVIRAQGGHKLVRVANSRGLQARAKCATHERPYAATGSGVPDRQGVFGAYDQQFGLATVPDRGAG